jgi:NLPA lipoprotein
VADDELAALLVGHVGQPGQALEVGLARYPGSEQHQHRRLLVGLIAEAMQPAGRHIEIVPGDGIDPVAKDAGLDFDIRVFDDYSLGDRWLSEGDIDANYFQHKPYFDEQIADFGYKLHAFPGVHIEPYAAFSQKYKSTDQLPNGAKISITDDGSNQTRALALLATKGLVTLPAQGLVNVHTVGNPKNFQQILSKFPSRLNLCSQTPSEALREYSFGVMVFGRAVSPLKRAGRIGSPLRGGADVQPRMDAQQVEGEYLKRRRNARPAVGRWFGRRSDPKLGEVLP